MGLIMCFILALQGAKKAFLGQDTFSGARPVTATRNAQAERDMLHFSSLVVGSIGTSLTAQSRTTGTTRTTCMTAQAGTRRCVKTHRRRFMGASPYSTPSSRAAVERCPHIYIFQCTLRTTDSLWRR
ncbi:hypothetical protein BC628DRAFT_1047289 [Trametes gibbosa]|nr:hypothetical protein BC628DRAFT_1047289 [Trametes gibbosa]